MFRKGAESQKLFLFFIITAICYLFNLPYFLVLIVLLVVMGILVAIPIGPKPLVVLEEPKCSFCGCTLEPNRWKCNKCGKQTE